MAMGILLSQIRLTVDFSIVEALATLSHSNDTEDPFHADAEENNPVQSENEDSKEVEEGDPNKYSFFQLAFSALSISRKLEWAAMDINHAMDPHIQEIQQPPELFC